MSTQYQKAEDVPSQTLADRLMELARLVAKADFSDFSMRIPAELDRDADLVMSGAARRIESLQDEVNGLTGSLDRAETVLQNLMSYLSVNGSWADVSPCEAEQRIRDGIDILVRPAVPAVPDDIIPEGDDFNGTTPHLIQCIESLVRLDAKGVLVPHGIGRDASKLLTAAANRLGQQSPAVPELDPMNRLIVSDPKQPKPPQQATSVPKEWRDVMSELAADLQSACDAEHPHRDQYPSIMRKYNNDMEIVEKARALLQSAEVTNAAADRLLEGGE